MTAPPVQATVSRFDPRTSSGAVLLDDGVELPFRAAAFRRGGLRLLRVGQRVRLEHDASGPGGRTGVVEVITILTLPLPDTRPGSTA